MLKLARKLGRRCHPRLMATCAAVVLALGSAGVAVAQEPPPITLPDSGVDIEGHITAAITAMGAVVAVVVGGFFAFMIVRKGLQWARGALRG
jgi:hypothetical protein